MNFGTRQDYSCLARPNQMKLTKRDWEQDNGVLSNMAKRNKAHKRRLLSSGQADKLIIKSSYGLCTVVDTKCKNLLSGFMSRNYIIQRNECNFCLQRFGEIACSGECVGVNLLKQSDVVTVLETTTAGCGGCGGFCNHKL